MICCISNCRNEAEFVYYIEEGANPLCGRHKVEVDALMRIEIEELVKEIEEQGDAWFDND